MAGTRYQAESAPLWKGWGVCFPTLADALGAAHLFAWCQKVATRVDSLAFRRAHLTIGRKCGLLHFHTQSQQARIAGRNFDRPTGISPAAQEQFSDCMGQAAKSFCAVDNFPNPKWNSTPGFFVLSVFVLFFLLLLLLICEYVKEIPDAGPRPTSQLRARWPNSSRAHFHSLGLPLHIFRFANFAALCLLCVLATWTWLWLRAERRKRKQLPAQPLKLNANPRKYNLSSI